MSDVINWLIEQVATLGEGITALLPRSPFNSLSFAIDSELLGYVNYFMPVDEAMSVLVVWGAAILLWYGYRIILKWVNAAE